MSSENYVLMYEEMKNKLTLQALRVINSSMFKHMIQRV